MGIVIEQLIYTCVLIRLKRDIHTLQFSFLLENDFFFSNGNAGGREWEVPSSLLKTVVFCAKRNALNCIPIGKCTGINMCCN